MAIRDRPERTARAVDFVRRTEFSAHGTPGTATPDRPSRRELCRLLNDDFARECQGVFAYAVYAERFRGKKPEALAECEARGRREVAHAMVLCQLVYDFDGAVTATVDDRVAVRRSSRVAHPRWAEETCRRLLERAVQLRTAGRPQLANRLLVLIDQKRTAPDLSDIVRRHSSQL
jgi:hypothetical protein